MNQHKKILAYMDRHGSITPMEAITEIGCTKLATRISELIRQGEPIEKRMIYSVNRDGDPVHYMRYSRAVRA